jgi:hypothetical protein
MDELFGKTWLQVAEGQNVEHKVGNGDALDDSL